MNEEQKRDKLKKDKEKAFYNQETRANTQEERAKIAHKMHLEAHELQMRREQERLKNDQEAQELAKARFRNADKTSGRLGNAHFGTLDEARELGLCNSAGLFLGTLERHGLYYNGNAHGLTIAPTRSGKGRYIILPNLAHIKDQSVIVTDVKNGENAYSSAMHRHKNLKSRIIPLNPHKLAGLPCVRLNPLDGIKTANHEEVFDRAAAAAHVLVPPKANDQNSWVKDGARVLVQTILAHFALTDPERCTLGNLWRFVVRDEKSIADDLRAMQKSTVEEIAGHAKLYYSIMKVKEQWAAYYTEMNTTVNAFAPNSHYTKATDASDFDARDITQEPCTVYLMMDGKDLEGKGRWVSLMLNHLIETTAEHHGPMSTLYMLDEFTQLPPIPAVLKALNLYAGKGLRLWFFAQDRKSIAALYGKEGAERIEAQAEFVQAFAIRDIELMRDLEYLGGKTSVSMVSASVSNGGQIGTGVSMNEQARNLLQPEDIRALAGNEQLIMLRRGPLFKAILTPWDKIDPYNTVLHDPRDILKGATAPPLND